MQFEVCYKNNTVFLTNYKECIPDYNTLKHMYTVGYRFKIDGKAVKLKEVIK